MPVILSEAKNPAYSAGKILRSAQDDVCKPINVDAHSHIRPQFFR
jgi:hypothetical protein